MWRPGTLNDVWKGEAGFDTANVMGNGGAIGADHFVVGVGLNCRLEISRVKLVPFSLDLDTIEKVSLILDNNQAGGNDMVTVGDLSGIADLVQVVVDGQGGNDVVSAGENKAAGIQVVVSGGEGEGRARERYARPMQCPSNALQHSGCARVAIDLAWKAAS